MDVVLEIFDGLLLDRLYAQFAPALLRSAALGSTIEPVAIDAFDFSSNSSFVSSISSVLPSNRPAHIAHAYKYSPSSHYISLPPSEWTSMSSLPRDSILRQALSLYLITSCFGAVVYFICASLSYVFVFDKNTFKHPKFLKNQISQEITQATSSIPVMIMFTLPFFLAEVRGYAKLYDVAGADGAPGTWYTYVQFPFFILFTDFFIYWIHRGLHHPTLYKRLHKPHHRWVMPTPYASHAFHPVDGFLQSIPYHVFPFLFPLQKWAYVVLFVFINIWTILIHDGEYVADSPIINGAACHTMHHLYFNYNYGQFTTLWDRLGGSYRRPNEELFRRETKMGPTEWERQTQEMEAMRQAIEGEDDRAYAVSKKIQ